ncbi:MAG: nucleotidyl transferase AbiEii/AbiGii toxin family protein [Clostridia bacterium]|nr:nucleotidyl transferase AbiEii/AbiGii toxin family protein [Clostridia bacterium]
MFGFFIKDEQIAYVRDYSPQKADFCNMSRDQYVNWGSRERHFTRGNKKINFEKTCRLIEILDFIFSQWSDKFVLKGGTAMNLFYRNMPRLSVDIDLDYVGSIDQTEEEVATDITAILKELNNYLTNNDYSCDDAESYESPENSFYSKVYSFNNIKGVQDFLKIEIKYNDRAMLMSPVEKGFEQLDYKTTSKVKLMNEYQLYAGKFGALVRRCTARDMFDVNEYIQSPSGLNEDLLRQCIVFDECISGSNRIESLLKPNWGKITGMTEAAVDSQLDPLLKDKTKFDYKSAETTITEYLKPFFDLTDNEKDFVNKFKNRFYDPTLLFESADMAVSVGWHPGAFSLCPQTWVSREDAVTMAKSLEHCGERLIKGMKAHDLFDTARNSNRKGFIFYRLFYGCSVLNSREDDERMLISQLVKASTKSKDDIDAIYEVVKCSALHDVAKSKEYYKAIIREELEKCASDVKDTGTQLLKKTNKAVSRQDEYEDKNY